VVETDIGWTALQLFNFERYLAQGSFLLPLWPSTTTEKKVGPAPDCSSHPEAGTCQLISIELPELNSQVKKNTFFFFISYKQ
jgi:phosphatidylinositol-4-phosphate 3-kinase